MMLYLWLDELYISLCSFSHWKAIKGDLIPCLGNAPDGQC